jgi:transposase
LAHDEEMRQLAAQHLHYDQLTFAERLAMGDRTLTRACKMAREAQLDKETHNEISLGAPYFQLAHDEEMRQLAAQHLHYDQLTFAERLAMGDRTLTRACEMAREAQRA